MIYFDNAATGGFKPSAVTDAAITTIKYLCANPGRSGHRLSVKGAEAVMRARTAIADLFNSGSPDRVVFTKNATEALNIALLGTAKAGGHIITTVFEHNSVLRPLGFLKQNYGIEHTVIDPTDNVGEKVANALRPETYLAVINHVSNVTGEDVDITAVKRALVLAGRSDVLVVADAAQSAGHTDIDTVKLGIDILCAAGHKGMCGIMGSGFLAFNERAEIKPIMFGGTGSDSLNVLQPEFYPERLESGTLNLPAVAGLSEAAEYVKKNIVLFSDTLRALTAALAEELASVKGVKLFSKPNKYGIISFSLDNIPSGAAADILSREYDIAVRGGLHCAPLIHKKLGTSSDGLIRASLAPQNSLREVYTFVKAVSKIASGDVF